MRQDLAFRVASALLFTFAIAASGWLRARADRAGGRVARSADTVRVALALRIFGLAFYGGLLSWMLYPPLVGWAAIALHPALRWLGAGLATFGVALQLWALHHLGRNVTPTAVARPDVELVDSGPYRRVRHPLYSGMLLTVPGFGLLSANLLVLAGGVLTFAVVAVRTRREEEELLARLGDAYADYRDRTGRFLPRAPRGSERA